MPEPTSEPAFSELQAIRLLPAEGTDGIPVYEGFVISSEWRFDEWYYRVQVTINGVIMDQYVYGDRLVKG